MTPSVPSPAVQHDMSEDPLPKPAAPSPLAPARRRVLADDVADSIREAIFSGHIDLGQRLIEEDLASMLDVSRGPVREALITLSQEGLISLERHRGASVAKLSVADLHEIYSMRACLERLAMEWACRNATEQDIARLETLLGEFDNLPAPRSQQAVASLDVAFHDGIFLAAHHRHLHRAWRGLRSSMFLYLVHRGALRPNAVRSWRADHEQLLRYLERREAELAVAAIQQHLDVSYRRALSVNAADRSADRSDPGA